MKIKVFASLDGIDLYNKGIEAGLEESAAEYFRYFNEIELDLYVDKDTGKVLGICALEADRKMKPDGAGNEH